MQIHGFAHEDVFLSAGVQLMVRSDVGPPACCHLDTEPFRDVVFVTASYGLGEMACRARSTRTSSTVYKPTESRQAGDPAPPLGSKQLRIMYSNVPGERVRTEDTPGGTGVRFSITDADVQELATALVIAQRTTAGRWSTRDGAIGRQHRQAYILQARPETVKSRAQATQNERYLRWATGEGCFEGRAIGSRSAAGNRARGAFAGRHGMRAARRRAVADMTDPDWEPVMKRSAVVTNRGGRTAATPAIIARELGVPPWSAPATRSMRSRTATRHHCQARRRATPASSTPAPCPSTHHHRPRSACRRRR